ncbi:MAG: M14 family metallopeptidase [Planctomycetota bacterium]
MTDFFECDYDRSRQRFRQDVKSLDGDLETYAIDSDQDLTIDIGRLGKPDAKRCLLLTTGVHGVEAPLGTAVLHWLLTQDALVDGASVRMVLVHAVNPYGFRHRRRVNETNVDLNRNFLCDGELYSGAPEAYRRYDPLLNPRRRRRGFDLFLGRAVLAVLRDGLDPLKQAVAGGQYEFPEGLFFGGDAASYSLQVFSQHFQRWISGAQLIAHLDFHTGLGEFGRYKLLLLDGDASEDAQWYRSIAPKGLVEPSDQADATAYETSGSLGQWCRRHATPDQSYHFANVEFGTYGPIRMLSALRSENQAVHHGTTSQQWAAKANLAECFCPQAESWRSQVIDRSAELLQKVLAHLNA